MIGKEIVTDAMAARTPEQLKSAEAEKITRIMHVTPVAQFKGGVKMTVRARSHQVDGVMIRTAAQEREEVAHPVGFAEAEHVDIELRDLLDVDAVERDVAELERHNALLLKFLMGKSATLEHFHYGAFRIFESHRFGDRRPRILLARGFDAVRRHLLVECIEVGVHRDLKTQAHALRFRALLQDD